MNITQEYKKFCEERNILFSIEKSVKPYDETTLFCPAGMQQFKSQFNNNEYKNTIANIQPCIRMNDFDEIGDLTHLLYFNMIGLFSFREMTIKDTITFWIEFLQRINIIPEYVTIHSDRKEWMKYYKLLGVNDIRFDDENCRWSDGDIGGYCTELFLEGIEIGNIVNPLDNCIDVGFGLERLEMFVNGKKVNKIETLKETALKIIESGYQPHNVKQGYVLRKILREIYKEGAILEHEFFTQEIERQNKIIERYNKLKTKYFNKSRAWWYDTHGINLDEIKH
ncbi:MAG TPA: alanine--tRNA ligase-related protein [Burkholderiales bacterium]|nr:alanine--tRNA ligase-related protein [Burkholderiales bacterium]